MLSLAFETSVAHPQQLPPPFAPEVAFAGRSNAGKSSALNALAGQSRLAFVSRTPGRTQLINIFRLGNGAALVDLPGYGYAQVPQALRQRWRHLLETYLTQRTNLAGLVLIMDCRHPFTDLDRQMALWFGTTGRPIHCLLTKADKLSRQAQAQALQKARGMSPPGLSPLSIQLFSSPQRLGVEEAQTIITSWLSPG
jgi:GTP-binding protein